MASLGRTMVTHLKYFLANLTLLLHCCFGSLLTPITTLRDV